MTIDQLNILKAYRDDLYILAHQDPTVQQNVKSKIWEEYKRVALYIQERSGMCKPCEQPQLKPILV